MFDICYFNWSKYPFFCLFLGVILSFLRLDFGYFLGRFYPYFLFTHTENIVDS